MAKISGVVQEVQQYDTKVGKMWNVVVGGEKYGNGKYEPRCAAGDVIEFEVSYNGNYKNVAPKTLVVTGKSAETPKPSTAPSSGGGFDARQDVISRQAALNSALEFVGLMASSGMLPIAASAKAGAKIEALEALVRKYTADFHLQSTGKEMPFPAASGAVSGASPADGEWS